MVCEQGGASWGLRQRLLVEPQPDVWWPLFLRTCQELDVPPEQLVGESLVDLIVRSERQMPSWQMRAAAWSGLHSRLHEVDAPDTFARALVASHDMASTRPAIGSLTTTSSTAEPVLGWAAQLKRQYEPVRRQP